jgi:hypothetical protein
MCLAKVPPAQEQAGRCFHTGANHGHTARVVIHDTDNHHFIG